MIKVNAEKDERPIMSRVMMKSGSTRSLAGFLNPEEFMKTLAKSVKQSTIAGFAVFAALTIFGDFENWYIGPYKGELAMIVAMIVGIVRAHSLGSKYLAEGDPFDDA